jgi:hypothetical protein
MKLITHPHVVPRLRMYRAIPPLLYMPYARKTDILPFFNLGLTTNILKYSEFHLVWVSNIGQLQAVLLCALNDEEVYVYDHNLLLFTFTS